MNLPFFSIVTVTLNAGDLLLRTIDSLGVQTCKEFEHIIKDGGSTDGSFEKARNLVNSYNHAMFISADSGIYDAMNQALLHCSGKYVLFLNAGDCLADPNVLANLLPIVSKIDSPGIIHTDYRVFNSSQIVKSPRATLFTLYRTALCHQTCFIRRDCYKLFGDFDTTFRVLADHELLSRLVRSAGVSVQYVPIIASEYLGGGFSTSLVARSIIKQEMKEIRKRYFSLAQRIKYCFIYSFTLPWFRNWFMQNEHIKWVRPYYINIVNSLYNVFSKLKHPSKFIL